MKKITLLLLLLGSTTVGYSQFTIKGTVANAMETLTEANVTILGTQQGTVTNSSGTFALKAKRGDTLAISYIGYASKKVLIENKKALYVVLEGAVLDEVIVTANNKRRICTRISCCWSSCRIIETIATEPELTVALYPNPSTDGRFNLKFLKEYEKLDVTVTNILGQQVSSVRFDAFGNEIALDLSQFSSGIYLVNVKADGKFLKTQKAIRK